MSTTTETDLGEYVIAILRAHEAELRRAGIRRLSLFGSVARGDAEADSDIDLAAELDPEAGIGLFALGALERGLAELVGRTVDLQPEPVEAPRLRASIDRDRRRAFQARSSRELGQAIPDGVDREAFARNGLMRDAVERCMERVCEAAHRVGERATMLMPYQPWGDIRGMGNRLRHAYDRISLEAIWNAGRNELPGLAADARRALAQLQAEKDCGSNGLGSAMWLCAGRLWRCC